MAESNQTSVDFFFDVTSPYSYLASTQVPGLARRTGVTIEWRPFLLGGLFKAIDNTAPAFLAPRGRYLFRDLTRWAGRYGVPFNWPTRFPMNTVTCQRMLVAVRADQGNEACMRLAAAFFPGYWADDADLADAEVAKRLADEAGFDGAALLERTQDPAVKEALIAATAEAQERGAFGAPTFFFGDEMYFGNDRLLFLEEALTAAGAAR